MSNKAKRFNRKNAVGTLVVVQEIKYITTGTATISEAYTNSSGVNLVKVRGFKNPKDLSKLRIIGKSY
jgi:hypothetical protein